MKTLKLILALLLINCTLWGVSEADSLKMAEWIRLSGRYCYSNPDSALLLNAQTIELAQQTQSPGFISKALNLNGVVYKRKSEYEKSEAAYKESIAVAREAGDSLLVAYAYYGWGALRRHQSAYSEALEFMNYSLKLQEAYGATEQSIARLYNGIATILYSVDKMDEAVEYFKKSARLHQKIDSPLNLQASSIVNVGGVYVAMKQPDSAMVYLQEGLKLYEELQLPTGIGAVSLNLSEALLLKGNIDKAESYAQIGLAKFKETNEVARVGMALNALALIQKEKGNILAAINYAEESLEVAKEVGRKDNIREELLMLSELYEASGDTGKAYAYFKEHVAIKDSLFNENSDALLRTEQQKFENLIKDVEIDRLKLEKEMEQRKRTGLLIVLTLLGIVLFLVLRLLQVRQKTLNRLREEQEKTKALLSEKEALLSTLNTTQNRMLEQEKLASIGQLTAGVAHEINNPVNYIVNNTEALGLDMEEMEEIFQLLIQLTREEEPKTVTQLIEVTKRTDLVTIQAEMQDLLKGIKNGSKKVSGIIKNLQSLAYPDEQAQEYTDIHDPINSSIAILNGALKNRINLIKAYGDCPKVLMYPNQINQAILNILKNAVQSIPEQGEIQITTTQKSGNLIVEVKDTGIGMSEETRKKIFEPFYTTKEIGMGTGLGMSIAYGIVQAHGGNIEIESEEGKGTRVSIILPLSKEGKAGTLN